MGFLRRVQLPESEPSGHNGGRTTTNPSDLIFGSEYPFINLLKTQDRLHVYGGSGGFASPEHLDDNGYPITIVELGFTARVYVPPQQIRPGRYVLDWVGNGEARVTGFPKTYAPGYDSGDLISTTGSGRVEFTPDTNINFFDIGFGTPGTPRITEMRLYHIDDEADLLAGKIFGSKFVERLIEAKMGRIRFLSWPDYNVTNMTTWRTRMPVGQLSYGSHRTVADGFCNPASNSLSGVKYSFAAPTIDISTGATFALADKAMCHIKHTQKPIVATFNATATSSVESIAVSGAQNPRTDRPVYVDSVVGQPFPTNYVNGRQYWIVEVPDSGHVKLSPDRGGAALAPDTSCTISIRQQIATLSGTITNSSDTISCVAHKLSVNDVVWTNRDEFGAVGYMPMYVTAAPTADTLKLSATLGGTAIAATATTSIEINPAIFYNVGGTGDKLARSPYGSGPSTAGNSYPEIADYQAYSTLTYDELIDSWIFYGGNSGSNACGIAAGVPPELMIALCEEVGAHPHFLAPRYAMDPMTDWMEELATLCRDTCPPWMKPAFEGPNEIFNGFTGFFNATWGEVKALYHWGVKDSRNWYGKVMSTMGQKIYSVYSNDTSKFDLVCGVQTYQGRTLGETAGADGQVESTLYLAQSAPAQSGYNKTSPGKSFITEIGTAQYWNPSDYGTAAEDAASASFAASNFMGSISGTALTVDSLTGDSNPLAIGKTIFAGDGIPTGGTTIVSGSHPNWVVDVPLTIGLEQMFAGDFSGDVVSDYVATCLSGTGPFRVSEVLTFFANWKTYAISKGINKICGYEGGYSPDMTGYSNPKDNFKAAGKQDPQLYDITLTVLNGFAALTGGGFTAEYPASYFGGNSPPRAVWPVIDDVYTTKYMPSFEAIKDFNA